MPEDGLSPNEGSELSERASAMGERASAMGERASAPGRHGGARSSHSAWQGGWLTTACHHPSPNHGERPAGALIDLIVIHSISLPPGVFGGDEVLRLFDNTLDWGAHPYFEQIRGIRVSAHFLIRRDGSLIQCVDVQARAWHAGPSFYRGRGDCNNDSVGIELEGLEGGSFEAQQYETLIALCADLAQRHPIAHVAGHEHVAPGRKADPGAGFDWPRLQAGLQWPAERFPRSVI